MAPKNQNWARSLTSALNLGTSVAAAVAIGWFGGQWLDNRYGTGNKLAIIGLLLGVAAAMKMLWQRMNQDTERSNLRKESNDTKNKLGDK